MALKKKWYVRFIPGGTRESTKVVTSERSPMIRSFALDNISGIEQSGWRGWVEDEAGHRIYETAAEKRSKDKFA
ncbi:hypothetical protein [Marinobacter lutaoensis]|uniref:hypothetical protein n=1 Tax=Marinobacter lutaoensis TaxID=135739 RepID=UPI0011156467|nr:hypothetical protein [Marinobacter lutaoensis]